jgi:hypothetical protein
MSELTLQAARRIDPKRIALALAGIWAIFALVGIAVELGHGDSTLQAFNLADSDLERRLSMPASFTGLLLLLASGMAFALSAVDRTRRQRTWRLAGLALVVFGLDELFGLHSWLEQRGVAWTYSYLPLLALGTTALYWTVRVFRSQRVVQVLFAAAVGLWLAGGVLDNPDLLESNAAAQIIEMAAAALLALCTLERLRYLGRQYYPLEEADTRLSVDQIAAEVVDRVKLRPLAIALVLLTAAFAIQDVLLHTGDYHGHRVPILDIGAEQTIWATFQGSLIYLVGLLALVTGRLHATPAAMRLWWTVLGGVLLVLGTDEIVALHNHFQDATGDPGQIVLIPVAIVGIVAWLKVLGATSGDRRVRNLFVGGAVLWLASQAIDVFLQEDFRWTIVPEETSETLGSACWALGIACWLHRVLPVGLMPPELVARLDGHALIEPLPAPGKRAQAPTG